MKDGDLLSKFLIYFFTLKKYSSISNDLQNEILHITTSIENMIQQIECLLIEHEHHGFITNVSSEIEKIWEETYNQALPLLILEQLSFPNPSPPSYPPELTLI